ncbi:MAG TPA: Gfo/Idh/MocA family oxidoreductase [Candidatus Methylacidiphilales bacterium]|nr:Gfo/Idh/MocA family oxidoreductase [Candidatus Methylacidiphilales bacterium]
MNIAFISTAHIHTRDFIKNITEATDGRKVAAVWDDVKDRGERYAAAAGAPYVASLDELLALSNVDAFIICAENTRHLPLLEKALPVGKPVFCEKPLVASEADLARVRELIAAYPNTPLFSGYFQPWMPGLLAIRQVLASDVLGKITRIRYRNAHHAAYGRWFDNPDLQWFTNPELAGGGAFMDMGTHAIHLVRTLFGPVNEVWAEIGNHAGIYPAVDDFGIAQLRFASGTLGTVEAAWTQTGGIGGLEVVGEKGSIWNTPTGYVLGFPGKPPEPIAPAAEGEPTRVDRLVALLQGKLSKEELKADLDAILDAVAIMSAAYASARSGNWVAVK